jgi:hypothetical protein
MIRITLGKGEYSVSSSHRIPDGLPSLTIKKLASPEQVGTLLDVGGVYPESQMEVIIEVLNPEAAQVLLTVAQGIAFAHGVKL